MGAYAGVSASLTSLELRVVNDLNNMNPHPMEWLGFVIPQSPMLVHGIPVGAEESDSDSCEEASDFGRRMG